MDPSADEDEETKEDSKLGENRWGTDKKHLKSLLTLIASEVNSTIDEIVDFELCLYDTQAPSLVGIHKEFIASSRIDNMMGSLVATHALVERSTQENSEATIDMIFCYDHEEVGSVSAHGAGGTITLDALRRIYNHFYTETVTPNMEEDFDITLRKSLYFSCDMNHCVHPNYVSKHQPLHAPKVHGGVFITVNVNQKFTTDSIGTAIVRELAARCDVPLQDYIINQGTPCGSTIGPTLSAKTGMKTVDIGIGQLAMHSIRELVGTVDALYYRRFMVEYFNSFTEVSASLLADEPSTTQCYDMI